MPERDGYIPGVPCWIDTTQPDPQKATAFYGELFGWSFEDVATEGPGHYFAARIQGGDVGAIGSQPEGAPPQAVWNTYIWVDSADEAIERVKAAGGSVIVEPFDVGPAGRMAVFADPEGAALSVWQAGAHKGARIVNEHGALVFNSLNTRDADAAARFYGAVFGWKVLDMGGGALMWQLPGYADHLEELNPGFHEALADAGAPDGFGDVVASLTPIEGDAPAHWTVTFAVDEADEIAAKAEELGGEVVVAPFDAQWVRTTVLRDPQGATFIASKFVPENRDLESPAASTAAAA